jgi:hypothetical protein
MSDLKSITYRPGAGEYAWTFGGAAPVMRRHGRRRASPCAVAVECAMNTVLIVDLIKGTGSGLPVTPWPRLESDAYVMSAGSARPLEALPAEARVRRHACPSQGACRIA